MANAVSRLLSASVRRSCAPGCGRSRRTITRIPLGQRARPSSLVSVDQHLLDPDLCPAAVATAHAVSLRTAQRLFHHSDDSLAAYIRRRRLTRARNALLSATTISEIAHHYGFYDAGHFTRAFKAEYDTSPSPSPSAYRKSWSHPHTIIN